MAGYQDFEPARVKHLELIQAVIARLGSNGFLVKGWAITVAGVFFGFAVNSENWQLALASILPTLAFWGLDAYFLRAERLFRELYRRVVVGDEAVAPFFMAATGPDFVAGAPEDVAAFWRTFFGRPALSVFYGAIVAAAGLVILIVFAINGAVQPSPVMTPTL